MYGYFDLTEFSALSKTEQTFIEKNLTKIYKKAFESMASSSASSLAGQHTITKANNIDKA